MKERKTESDPFCGRGYTRFHIRTLRLSRPEACIKNIAPVVKVVRLRTRPFLSLFVHYKVMQNFYFIGIDVSKKKLDICVMSKSKVLKEEQVSNHPQAIASVIAGLKRRTKHEQRQLHHLRGTHRPIHIPLMCACKSVGCKLWLEKPSQIKYCSGSDPRQRTTKWTPAASPNTPCDSSTRQKPYKRPTEELVRLKQLEAERSLYLTDLAKYKAQLTDQDGFMEDKIFKRKARRLKAMINSLEKTPQGNSR